jgi:hypothetical protein
MWEFASGENITWVKIPKVTMQKSTLFNIEFQVQSKQADVYF